MELDEVFTTIKKRVMESSILPDKYKEVVRHILIKTYKECVELDKELDTMSISDNNQKCTQSETDNIDFLKGIFGGLK